MVLKGSEDILKVKMEDCFVGLINYCAHRGLFWVWKWVADFGSGRGGKEPAGLFVRNIYGIGHL